MKFEAELKAYANDFAPVIEKLEEVGAELISKRTEKDTYFSHPIRDFAKTDEALRLREMKDLSGEPSASSIFELTFKGPKIHSGSKSREEYMVKLNEIDEVKEILEQLGCEIVTEVSKIRSMYDYNDYTICLDEVDGLGNFIEIEKILDTDIELDSTVEAMREIIKDLFGFERFERLSYMELLLEKRINTQ
jgi:adenylate cyclase class 2